MAARRDRNGLEVLDRQACLDLLATVAIGRLAHVTGGVPRVSPLNVTLDGDRVFFRLSTGDALAAIESGQLVTLEVDDFDPLTCCGWSVTVTDVATEIPAAVAAHPGTARAATRGSAGASGGCSSSRRARSKPGGSVHVSRPAILRRTRSRDP